MNRVYAISKSTAIGVLAAAGLLGFYFLVLSLVSDWAFTVDQFTTFRYYVLSLDPLCCGQSAAVLQGPSGYGR